MYSAVLMLALTAGSESIDFGKSRCHGSTSSYACSGAVVVPSCSTYVACHAVRSHGCTTACSSRGGLFHRNRCSCPPVCSSTVVYGCTTTYGCATYVVPAKTPEVKKDMPKGEKIDGPKKTGAVNVPATIIVSLPTDARLSVDGTMTTSTSERRTLVTPVLEGDSTYVYTMQAEVTREGRVMTQTQQVTVRGGEISNVQFNFSTQSVASR
jgi:uncharacterized protein (TIGR03000 family)